MIYIAGDPHSKFEHAYDEFLGFKAFGVELRGVSDVNGRCVLPGELDYQNQHKRKEKMF